MSETSFRITIVIPAYNYAKVLPRALMSVISQRQGHHEVIVIDDGSTDATPEVLSALGHQYPGAFRVVRKNNGGLASVRNRGIVEATTPWLIFLDADDELAPGALVAIDSHIGTHPKTEMIIGAHVSIEPDGRRREHKPGVLPEDPVERVRAYLLDKRLTLANGACVMHKAVFSQSCYPERFRNAEDIPVFAQALGNHQCSLLLQPLALIHKHDDSLRHQFHFAKATGTDLVDEVFSPKRLDERFGKLKHEYAVQRNLSLFRTAYLAGEYADAKLFFKAASSLDPFVWLKLSYSKKAIRLWLMSEKLIYRR